ncbi:WD40 repeat domain-containing protein [Planomonospora algeriensis]
MTAPWGPWRRNRWAVAVLAVLGLVIGLALAFRPDSGPIDPRPLTGPWRPPPLPVTVGYAWWDQCPYGSGPAHAPRCSGWQLAVRSGEPVAGASPVGGSEGLQRIEVPDAVSYLSDEAGPNRVRAPFQVSSDGRRVAYLSATGGHFVAHDLASGRRIELDPGLLGGLSAQDRLDLRVSEDGRFFSAARLGGEPEVYLTDFETGLVSRLEGVCEILSLGRDAREIVGVPCRGGETSPSEGEDRPWAVFGRDGARLRGVPGEACHTGVHSDVTRGHALVSADGEHAAGLYWKAFHAYGTDFPDLGDVLTVRSVRSGRILRIVRLPASPVPWSHQGMAGDRAVLRDGENGVHLVNLVTGGIHQVLDALPDSSMAIVFGTPATRPVASPPAPSGGPPAVSPPPGVLSGCTGDPCKRWHLATDAVPVLSSPETLPVPGLFAVGRDGRHLAYGRTEDLRLVVHDLKTGRALPASDPLDPDAGFSDRLALFFTPDGRRLAFQPAEGRPVQLTDIRTGRRSRFRVGPGDGLIGWTPTGPVVHRVTADEDGPYESELRFLSPAGKHLRTVRTDDWPGSPPSGVSPDGRRVVTPSGEETPLIIDVATGREVRPDITRYGGRRHWVFQGWVTSDEILVRTEGTATREYGVLTLSTGELEILR